MAIVHRKPVVAGNQEDSQTFFKTKVDDSRNKKLRYRWATKLRAVTLRRDFSLWCMIVVLLVWFVIVASYHKRYNIYYFHERASKRERTHPRIVGWKYDHEGYHVDNYKASRHSSLSLPSSLTTTASATTTTTTRKKETKNNQQELSDRVLEYSDDIGDVRDSLRAISIRVDGKKIRQPNDSPNCQPMREWQETSFPSCSTIHEIDFHNNFRTLASGGYNSVFSTIDVFTGKPLVIKILEWSTDFTDRDFDRVRRDGMVMERLTKSKYSVNMYAFCGFALVVERGNGNLDNLIYKRYSDLSQNQKLQLAATTAQALADAQNIDGDEIPSLSHGDFATKQYILMEDKGVFKLNDYNRGRFIYWNNATQAPCKYTIGNNDGKFRAPEEYQYVPETAAIDVWALGSIFFELLTGKDVWNGYSTRKAQKRIAKGETPPIPESIRNSTDPIDRVLLKAIDMCYVYKPEDRPKPWHVANYLKMEAKQRGVDWEAPFRLKRGHHQQQP